MLMLVGHTHTQRLVSPMPQGPQNSHAVLLIVRLEANCALASCLDVLLVKGASALYCPETALRGLDLEGEGVPCRWVNAIHIASERIRRQTGIASATVAATIATGWPTRFCCSYNGSTTASATASGIPIII